MKFFFSKTYVEFLLSILNIDHLLLEKDFDKILSKLKVNYFLKLYTN